MKTTTFPKYFIVDNEIYVQIVEVGKQVIATNDLGNPYSPYKAMIDGREITKEEFEKGAAKRQKEFPRVTTPPTV